MFATVWNKEDEKNLSLPQTALSQSFNRLNTWFVSETAGRLPQKYAYEGFGTFFADKMQILPITSQATFNTMRA